MNKKAAIITLSLAGLIIAGVITYKLTVPPKFNAVYGDKVDEDSFITFGGKTQKIYPNATFNVKKGVWSIRIFTNDNNLVQIDLYKFNKFVKTLETIPVA